MPVDLYVGGAEHTVGHLLYARMWQRFLYEQGLVRDPEPFQKLVHQGMITAFTYYDEGKRVVLEKDVEERDGRYFRKGTGEPLTARIDELERRGQKQMGPRGGGARWWGAPPRL